MAFGEFGLFGIALMSGPMLTLICMYMCICQLPYVVICKYVRFLSESLKR
jgi:hypothetical protein